MLAVYQTLDGVGTLGSIRSSRPYYIELALGHDALYVHAGGSPEAYQDLKSWKVNNIDGVNGSASQSAVFWRDQERRKTMDYEHTLVTSGENDPELLGRQQVCQDPWGRIYLFPDLYRRAADRRRDGGARQAGLHQL